MILVSPSTVNEGLIRRARKAQLAERTSFDIGITATGQHPNYPAKELFSGQRLREVLDGFVGLRYVDVAMCVKCCNQRHWGVWCLRIQSNGVRIATLRCLACGLEMATRGAGDEHMPLWSDNHDREPCERCGNIVGTETHHWAPRHLFDDADDWPTAQLCPDCHRLWHSIVTPHMHRKVAR